MNIETLTDTVFAVPDVTDEALDGAQARMRDAWAPQRSSHNGRRWAFGIAAGVAAAVTGSLIIPTTTAEPATAKESILEIAYTAGSQEDLTDDGQFWHKTVESYQSPDSTLSDKLFAGTNTVETWYPMVDGAVGVNGPLITGGHSQAVHFAQPIFYIGGEAMSVESMRELPTDPVALRDLIVADLAKYREEQVATGAGEGQPYYPDSELWSTVTSMMRLPTSPELRQALFQVAAGMPAIDFIGAQTDSQGREGVALRYSNEYLDDGWYETLLVDPQSGAVLESVVYDPDGTMMARHTTIVEEPTDTAPQADWDCGPEPGVELEDGSMAWGC